MGGSPYAKLRIIGLQSWRSGRRAHRVNFQAMANRKRTSLIRMLAAIIAGNVVYFAIESRLPAAAQHHAYHPDLGTLVDFWFCVVFWGLLELMASFLAKLRR